MALVKRRASPTRTFVIAGIMLAVGGIILWLVRQVLVPTIAPAPSGNTNRSKPVITEFGEEILRDNRYRNLKPFGKTPTVDVNRDAGNPNPFQ